MTVATLFRPLTRRWRERWARRWVRLLDLADDPKGVVDERARFEALRERARVLQEVVARQERAVRR